MNSFMASLKQRRWFNPSLPQMLQIAVFLLYFQAFFGLIDALDRVGSGLWLITQAVLVAIVPLGVMGGLGVSEERKRGYLFAVAAAAGPFVWRLLFVLQVRTTFPIDYGVGSMIKDVVLGDSILSFAFEAALLVLLLHPKSREHVKIWFR
jgi:hypothetical protein